MCCHHKCFLMKIYVRSQWNKEQLDIYWDVQICFHNCSLSSGKRSTSCEVFVQVRHKSLHRYDRTPCPFRPRGWTQGCLCESLSLLSLLLSSSSLLWTKHGQNRRRFLVLFLILSCRSIVFGKIGNSFYPGQLRRMFSKMQNGKLLSGMM